MAANAVHVFYLVSQSFNLLSKHVTEDTIANQSLLEDNTRIEQYMKVSIPPPPKFSGNICKWTPWKVESESIYSLLGLEKILHCYTHFLANPDKNVTVCHLLRKLVANGNTLRVFSGDLYENDGNHS